jgi:copper ion binding protein
MSNSTVQEMILNAPDISCGHCVATINQAVGQLEGVRRVEASEATKQVMVEYDPNRVTLAQIEDAMEDAGYPVQK